MKYEKSLLISQILDGCRQQGLKIVTAESCTGGLLCAALTSIAGASDVVESGFVTYSNASKMTSLGVTSDDIKSYGAVSIQVAAAMATGALARSGAHISISITGVAGPGSSDAKPEGMVCFALATIYREIVAQTVLFGAIGRDNVRSKSVEYALQMLTEAVERKNS